MASFFLVRHGRYDYSTKELTKAGREIDAPAALNDLLLKGLGQGALILSSSARRALQTAEVIAEGLSSEVISSEMIEAGGSDVWGVRDLDEYIGRALSQGNAELQEDGELVVVTHAPMVAAAMGMHGSDAADLIRYGQVVEYQTGTWTNPKFRASLEI